MRPPRLGPASIVPCLLGAGAITVFLLFVVPHEATAQLGTVWVILGVANVLGHRAIGAGLRRSAVGSRSKMISDAWSRMRVETWQAFYLGVGLAFSIIGAIAVVRGRGLF